MKKSIEEDYEKLTCQIRQKDEVIEWLEYLVLQHKNDNSILI